MFAGIVAGKGRILAVGRRPGTALTLTVDVRVLGRRLGHGESVSVAGVCLTVVRCARGRAEFDVIGETVRCTTLGNLAQGDEVNLEASLCMGDPIGGHQVQGHVDGVGAVTRVEPRGDETRVTIRAPRQVHRTLVRKGWVAVDGVSLTVADLGQRTLTVALIPTTLEITTLGRLAKGDAVNLEGDPLGRHVVRWLEDSGREIRGRRTAPPRT